jgi:tRNA threonylcarbamoyladenosine biosynthesis protein TsaB
MNRVLHLETTAAVCSVALSEDDRLVQLLEHEEPNAHSRVLLSLINQLLLESGWSRNQLDAVALSAGPGSYTGLRIGSSTAKGLCFSLGIPLIAVDTLQAMAHGARILHPGCSTYIPMLDARRMEVYTATYNASGDCLSPSRALIVEENVFENILQEGSVLFCGNGVEKCLNYLHHRNAVFEILLRPSASHMLSIAHNRFINNELEDIAYFEPRYLKDFWSPGKILA